MRLPFLLFTLIILSTFTFGQEQREKRKKETPWSIKVRTSEAEALFIEGEKFYLLEDYSKSFMYFLRASELNPENAAIYYKLAEILTKSNKTDDLLKASAYIDQSLHLEKRNKYYYLLASTINTHLGRFSKSAALLETMLKQVPGTEEYLYDLASTYLSDQKEDLAIKTYNHAETLFGINEVSSLSKQRIYLSKNKIQEAIAEGEKLIQAYPDEEGFLIALIEILTQHQQPDKAIHLLEKKLHEKPQLVYVKMLLCGLYRETGKEKKSYELALSLMSDTQLSVSNKLTLLGTYAATIGKNKKNKPTDNTLIDFVVELYTTLKKAHPNDANVYTLGGDIYSTLERIDAAKKEYLHATQLEENNLDAWQNLLRLYVTQKQYDSALLYVEKALEIFPYQSNLYYFNGYALWSKGKFRSAIQPLEQAKKFSLSNSSLMVEINTLLGDSYQAVKDFDQSAKAYEEALSIDPTNDIVLNNYSYYLALRKTDLEKAEKMSSLLIKNYPDNISYLDTHAWVLYHREKYKEAKKIMQKVISFDHVTSIHWEHYGDILYQTGDIEGAVVQWIKAQTMDSDNERLQKKIIHRKLF